MFGQQSSGYDGWENMELEALDAAEKSTSRYVQYVGKTTSSTVQDHILRLMDHSPTFIACKSETASDICISNIGLDGHPNDPTGATKPVPDTRAYAIVPNAKGCSSRAIYPSRSHLRIPRAPAPRAYKPGSDQKIITREPWYPTRV